MRRAFRFIGRLILHLVDYCWAAGAVVVCASWWIGWFFKDETPFTQWLFFIPPIAVIVFGFLWLFLTLRYRFILIQFFVFITIGACFYKVLVTDHRWNPPPTGLPANNIRILHWNTAWGVLGVESIVRTMSYDNPDIVVISEPPRLDMISDIAYHALGMENVFTDLGMTVASQYPITYLGEIGIENLAAWHANIDTDKGRIELVAADMVSRPNLQRKPPLQALADWVGARTNTTPLVIIGDFNTPHDSVAFGPLRRRMRQAYEVHGRGWPYTWPIPFPVYAIDQTWVSHGITVNDYFLKEATYSDHRRQIIDISLNGLAIP